MEILVIFILSFVPLLWFRGNQMILGHDSGFRLNPAEHLGNLLFGWHENANFGIDWSLYHGFIPIQLPEALASFMTGSIVWGQRLAFVWWFLIIGLSMVVFTRYFFPAKPFTLLRLVAPVYWMFNFYILQAWAIAERAKFSLYIALPLMIVIFFKTARNQVSIFTGAAYFGLLFFFTNGGGSPPLYGAIFVTFGLLVVFFLVTNFRVYVRRISLMALAFWCSFALFNAYWILPQVRLFSGNYAQAIEGRGGISGLIAWEQEISRHASIPNILRLQGFPGWYDNPAHPYAVPYLTHPILIIFSWVPVVAGICALIFLRKKFQKKDVPILVFLLMLGAVGLFFTAGSHPPFGVFYTYLMRHVPGFAAFRSSFYKFAPTVYLPVILYFSYSITLIYHGLAQKIRRVGFNETLAGLAIAAGIVLFHYPYLTGNIFRIEDSFTTRVDVPPYVAQMSGFIRSNTTDRNRILLVPPLDTGFINSPIDTYKWGFYSLDILQRIAANRSFLANDSNDNGITGLLYRALGERDTDTFIRLSQVAGVTHVLVRDDVMLSGEAVGKLRASEWNDRVSESPLFQEQYKMGEWTLYLVGLGAGAPAVYAASDIYEMLGNGSGDAYVVGHVLTGARPVLIKSKEAQQPFAPDSIKERFVEAECYFCKLHEYTRLLEAVTLPVLKNSRLPLLKNRQSDQAAKAVRQTQGTLPEIDARLSLASLLLAQGNPEGYRRQLEEIVGIIDRLAGRDRDVYANRAAAFAEAHANTVRGQEAQTIIKEIRSRLEPYVWRAQGDIYRFGVTVPEAGSYRLWFKETEAYGDSIVVDGVTRSIGGPLFLEAGYHRIALTATTPSSSDSIASPVFLRQPAEAAAREVPNVTFTKVNPTQYEVKVEDATRSFWLVMNQRFDPRWVISASGVRQQFNHLEANGFANAWHINKTGTFTLSLSFAPQRQFYLGAVISVISWVAGIAYIARSTKR